MKERNQGPGPREIALAMSSADDRLVVPRSLGRGSCSRRCLHFVMAIFPCVYRPIGTG